MALIVTVLTTKPFQVFGRKIAYTPDHVRWVKRQCDIYAPGFDFVCLSDVPIQGVETVEMVDRWPGWWGKIELFRHFGDCFYMDLDTVLTADISEIASYRNGLCALKNLSGRPGMGSGLMSWDGDYSFIYNKFSQKPRHYMEEYRTKEKWGDQIFIQDCQKPTYFQDAFDGQIKSYKYDLLKGDMINGVLPKDCKIVCFHGKPKPQDVRHSWIIS